MGRYYTVSGGSTQINGVISDVIVPTKLFNKDVGEAFLEYPLPSDHIAPSYDDTLSDLDFESKRWFTKYYLPNLQKKESVWRDMIPTLASNSHERIKSNPEYQAFFKVLSQKDARSEDEILDDEAAGTDKQPVADLQMQEGVNIVKDMMMLEPENHKQARQLLVESQAGATQQP